MSSAMDVSKQFTSASLLLISVMTTVYGHGYLFDPPGRSSMWRWPEFKGRVESNYNDNALRCSGNKHSIRCGVCGDPVYGLKKNYNMAGGKYAKGIISRTYLEGQIINVKVKITKSHMGHFEFRLCPNNNVSKPITQECLDKYPLRMPGGAFKYKERGHTRMHTISLVLPTNLTCSQCVLQWIYITDNNPGGDWIEQFRGCSDIAISPRQFLGILRHS